MANSNIKQMSIKYNGVELYPTHIFDWRASGINCATEDYSIGSVNNIVVTFVTDSEPQKDQTTNDYYPVYVDGVYFVIRDVTKTAGQNRWTVNCASDYFNLDAPLPDSYATPVANETVWQLFNRLQGATPTSTPTSFVNGDTEINPSWYTKGMTYRQAFTHLCRMMGVNIRSFLKSIDVSTPTDISRRYKLSIPNQQESDVMFFTPKNVKEIEIADYTVPAITGLYVEQPIPIAEDVGLGNDLYLPYNPMADPADDSWARDLLDDTDNGLKIAPTYTPMKITTWTDAHYYEGVVKRVQARDLIYWSTQRNWMRYTDDDGNVYNCPIFSWELTPSGLTLQGTGNVSRTVDSGYSFENELVSQINDLNDRFISANYKNASSKTYDVPSGMYLVTTAQYGADSNASDGMWLVRVSSSYHHSTPPIPIPNPDPLTSSQHPLLPYDGTSVSTGLNQITVNRGSAKTTVCITRIGG